MIIERFWGRFAINDHKVTNKKIDYFEKRDMIAVKSIEQRDLNKTLEEYQKSRYAKSETRANRFKQSRPAVGTLFD